MDTGSWYFTANGRLIVNTTDGATREATEAEQRAVAIEMSADRRWGKRTDG
jgi:hypothetical protein